MDANAICIFVGSDEYSFCNHIDINILGQMEWFDLIDEIITTAFITPLYYLLKKKDYKKKRFLFLRSFGGLFLF